MTLQERMMVWTKVKVAAVVAVLVVAGAVGVGIGAADTTNSQESAGASGLAAIPATLPADLRPVQEKLDIPALVREVRASEAWISDVDTFHVVLQGTYTRSQQSIQKRTADLLKLDPQDDLSPDRHPDLLAKVAFRNELAFDRNRAAVRRVGLDDGTFSTTIWDGRQQVIESKPSRLDEVHTSTSASAPSFQQTVLNVLSCFRIAYHSRWPMPPGADGSNGDDPGIPTWYGVPEDFVLAGQTNYRGTDCYLLVCRAAFRRWYVGVADHRIYGHITHAFVDTVGDGSSEKERIILQLGRERRGQAMTMAQLDAWVKSLPHDKQDEFCSELSRRTYHLSVPFIEYWMRDYKEVSPGRFFPMTQGWVGFPGRPETFTRESTVTEIEINQPLPDELFQ